MEHPVQTMGAVVGKREPRNQKRSELEFFSSLIWWSEKRIMLFN